MSTMKMESKTYQYRKVTKPLLERKRRARINKCLDELKDLMVDCMRQQGDNIARLEKADILELTVEHLRQIRIQKMSNKNHHTLPSTSNTKNNNNVVESFRSGYVHAANEVSRALATLPRVDINLGTQLMTHLGHRLNQLQSQQQHQQQQQQQSQQITTPLTVYCDNHDNNSPILMSPAPSSGYGSDNESINSQSSSAPASTTNQHQYERSNLLQVVAKNNQIVWRPW